MSQEKKDDKIGLSQFFYEQVNRWIENADNKVNISCGIFTGVFGVITFLSERIVSCDVINDCWRFVYCWSFVISLILMFVSILCYVLAINPNLGKSGETKLNCTPKKKSPIFFGDIAELLLEDYKDTMNQTTTSDIIEELQTETYYNSKICNTKMKRYKMGLWFSFAAIVVSLISLGAHFCMFHG